MTNPWLHRFALLAAGATLLLLAIGGLVTSHGVGMAVPDWPNTYGYNMFFFPVSQWAGGIFYEHTHRLVASAVGLLTSILTLWLYGQRAQVFLRWVGLVFGLLGLATLVFAPSRRADALVLGVVGCMAFGAIGWWPRGEAAPLWLRRLGLAAFVAVVLQGVLGGLRVVLLRDQIGVFHATLAQLFFALICSIGLFTSRWWHERSRNRTGGESSIPRWTQGLFVLTSLLILTQLVLGATMRHQHAGLAIADFPLAYGKLWPSTDPDSVVRYNQHRLEIVAANPITALQIELQMAHRMVACLILGAVLVCAWAARRAVGARHASTRLAYVWLGLISIQLLLGAATIWSGKAADIATGHVLIGALSLAVGNILCIVSIRDWMLAQNPAPQPSLPGDFRPAAFGPHPSPAAGLH